MLILDFHQILGMFSVDQTPPHTHTHSRKRIFSDWLKFTVTQHNISRIHYGVVVGNKSLGGVLPKKGPSKFSQKLLNFHMLPGVVIDCL